MVVVKREHGVFAGECGVCLGRFMYIVEDRTKGKPEVKSRIVLKGKCPQCDSELKTPVD
jgi:hypothetical protein